MTKGYTQTYDIDYQETFAPVAKINTVKSVVTFDGKSGLSSLPIGCEKLHF